jgi:protein-S-isoprenylcysteine O-methyltransferase Ste14
MPVDARPGPGLDVGRIFAVTIFVFLIALNALSLRGRLLEGGVSVLDGLVSMMTLAFYVLLTIAYLRRSRTSATDRDWRSWLVAFLGTGSPFLIPIVASGLGDSEALAAVAAVVLICGLAFMMWSLFHLGSNISMVPQARAVVTKGPYAWVRHPLYVAEIVSAVGICLTFSGVWPWVVLVISEVPQFLRARNEERLLERELPGYRQYRARTPMLVPMGRHPGNESRPR